MSFKRILGVLVALLLLTVAFFTVGCENKNPPDPPVTDDGKATYTISVVDYKGNTPAVDVLIEVQKDGALGCALKTVEVMGRDISVVCTHPLCENTAIRAIVDADNLAQIGGSTVRFALKPAKVHLFDPATGDRIRF